MDLQQILATFRGDLDKLKQAIESLEQLQQRYQLPKSRGGRTWMGRERAKGRFGTHDALWAGLASGTPAYRQRRVLDRRTRS